MIVIGIDPGLTGAAVLTLDGKLLECADLPVCARPGGAGGKVVNWLDVVGLARVLREWSARYEFVQFTTCVVIEQPAPMPSMPSTTSASLFDTVGAIRGVIAALGLGRVHVDPKHWKRAYGLKAGDKDASRECAQRLFPTSANLFKRAKDHNRAEAALLAHWGMGEIA